VIDTATMFVTVDNRKIGPGHPCYVIAEAGSNHDGSLDQAFRLIDVAADAGADAVKFQLFRARTLYSRGAGVSDYLKSSRDIYDIVQQLELPEEWLPRLSEHSGARGLHFLATPFDEESADRLDGYVSAFKIASYEITHLPLIRHVSLKKKPLLLSTGASTIEEIQQAVDEIRRAGNPPLILLQCTAAYPAPLEALNIRVVRTLAETFGVLTGFSDHSADPLVAPLAAVGQGAVVLEKHFTVDKELPGPDHRFALNPDELRRMIRAVRDTETALGSPAKAPEPVEQELRAFARRFVYTTRDISAGEVLSKENIAVLRAGKKKAGLAPADYPSLCGRRAARAIPRESPLEASDVE
jgi:N-acetylneuraminate synthase